MTDFALIQQASQRLDRWIERENFMGWDPYDALNSPFLKALTFGNRRIGQGWVQLLKRSPINLRPLLRVRKGYNPKGMGLFLASYLRKYQMTGDVAHLERVKFFAEWLRANVSPGYHGACWGYNFDWPNRGFFAPAGTPTIVNTAFIGLAFMDVLTLGDTSPLGPLALSLAKSASEFILRDLHAEAPTPDELGFSYTPLDRRVVHNANMLGAWLLAEVGARMGDNALCEAALKASRFTVHRQRTDGAWLYGVTPYDDWIDNFHTGYVLSALKRISSLAHTSEFDQPLQKGYAFWKTHFFLTDGTPKYYENATYPIDTHCAAQAILTFLAFADVDPEAKGFAVRIARWGIEHLQSPQGYFYYQLHRPYPIRIPYMRWTQAWMQRALMEVELQIR
ncbi:MAG: exopolysaccharide biosynthesis protein VpsJ [Anaerolineales bacterium]